MAKQEPTDTLAVRKEYVTRLTERIKSLNSPIAAPDLQYLYDVTRLQEFDFTSHAGSQESRVQFLLDSILTGGPEMLFGGQRYLAILITSPEWPLLVEELGRLVPLMDRLQETGSVTFDFGMQDGLGVEAELLIVKTN